MQGWIVYNGALRVKKVKTLVEKLAEEGEKHNVSLTLIKNNEILIKYDREGNTAIKLLKEAPEPQFIIFWDKDVLLARHLEKMGYRLFNQREALEVCSNKALTHLYLANKGIRVPKTIASPFTFSKQNLTDKYIEEVFNYLGQTIIVKIAYGSFGMHIYKVDSKEEFIKIVDEFAYRPFIMQEYIESSFGRDIRVNIVGDKVIGAMARKSEVDFRSNITLGGTGKVIALTKEQKELALKAHKVLNLDYSGVDILYGKNEEPIICEVNSNLNYLSFEEISDINVSEKIIEHIKANIK